MLEDVLKDLRESFEATIKGLRGELIKLRTGRANLGMLEGIRVEYYGSQVPLNQVANMKVADARLITIQPWETNLLGDIERAIATSDLGFNPSNDGAIIRVPIPQLTGERRQDLVKLLKRVAEDHKISLRNHRRDANDMLKALQKDGDISEDDAHRGYDRINKMTEEYTKKIDEIAEVKEQEILEV